MINRRELNQRLLSILKELERDQQYRGLKDYVRNLKRKGYLNGKKKFLLRGATARLNRLQADRRSRSLGLTEYIPYDGREDINKQMTVHRDYKAWDRTVELFLGMKSLIGVLGKDIWRFN